MVSRDEPAPLEVDLGAPPAIPEVARTRVMELLTDGCLHRYAEARNIGEEVSALEREFAAFLGRKYAIGVNSCGSTMFLSLMASGVVPGAKVLMNGFTLAPVPGAIAHAGAVHVLVDITDDLVIDLGDLDAKARATGAKHLLLSHMRGHIADMDAVVDICRRRGITLVEDCAHTLGASWAGRPTGTFGAIGCFSFQSYKHINTGEGGMLVTDDADIAARAILYSGSYMLYGQHEARPPTEAFERWKLITPNFSLRMSSLVAALARAQLPLIEERAQRWNDSHDRIAAGLSHMVGVRLPRRPQAEGYVQSSIQFAVSGLGNRAFATFLDGCRTKGVFIKWFGAKEPAGYTSQSHSWAYIANLHTPANTARALERLCDIRIPLSLEPVHCGQLVAIVEWELARARTL
ncbi:MAG: aminotransferase [Alphaproteobacteria bacterium]|nr:aminotransferase [Alphaproteobacteria bacterium]